MQVFGETKFLSFSELAQFIEQSRFDVEREDSLLDFELREQPCSHFCGWCGLNAHQQGDCTHGN